MKQHKGIRPHDIVILLKINAKQKEKWFAKDLATELYISQSEVSESLQRSSISGLLSQDKKRVMKSRFLEFLEFGLPVVFPQVPGAIVRGMPTAHSGPTLRKEFMADEIYVWPDSEGKVRGQTIEPLHPGVVKACMKDQKLYELLSLVDALRVGKVREKTKAVEELKKRIKP